MMPLSDDKLADIIDAFNTTSRYFDDILNINDILFRQYGGRSFNCRNSVSSIKIQSLNADK